MSRGEKVFCIHSKKKHTENETWINLFKENNDIRHLTSVTKLSEGTDIPSIDTIVCFRPSRSPVLYIQMAGRGLRPYPNKEELLFLDYGGVVRNLGHPFHPKIKSDQNNFEEEERKNNFKIICPICGTFYFSPREICTTKIQPQNIICSFKFPSSEFNLESLTKTPYNPNKDFINKKIDVLSLEYQHHVSQKGARMIRIKYLVSHKNTESYFYQYFFLGDTRLRDFRDQYKKYGKPSHVRIGYNGFVYKCLFDKKINTKIVVIDKEFLQGITNASKEKFKTK